MPVRTAAKPGTTLPARVCKAIELREGGMRPTQVAMAIVRRFKVSLRTAWKDVRAAENAISDLKLADLPRVRRELTQFYEDMMVDAVAHGDRMAAIKAASELAKITGANAAQKLELTGGAGVLVVAPAAPSYDAWAGQYGGRPPAVSLPANGKNGAKS